MAKADTKTQLMDVAEQSARKHGVDGFSYADLSDEVGIRKASIHYHFPAKSDLLTELMRRYSSDVGTVLSTLTNTFETPEEQINAFIDLYRNALQNGSTLCLCVAYAISTEGLTDGTRAEMTRFREEILSWLIKTLKATQEVIATQGDDDLQAEAAAILALVEGAQISARIEGSLRPFDLATETLRRKFARSST